jgi:hypothetical protein
LGVPIRAALEIAWKKYDCSIPCHYVICPDRRNHTCPPDVVWVIQRKLSEVKNYIKETELAQISYRVTQLLFFGRIFTSPLHM